MGYRFETAASCPVCGETWHKILHDEPAPDPMLVAYMVNPFRRDHDKGRQSCRLDPRWVMGWNLATRCLRDTDGDGNCHEHPQGCPTANGLTNGQLFAISRILTSGECIVSSPVWEWLIELGVVALVDGKYEPNKLRAFQVLMDHIPKELASCVKNRVD